MSTALQMIGGSVALLALGAALGETRGLDVSSISLASWIGWVYLITFGALVGFTAYVYLLRNVSPAKASTYAYVNPIVAVILGWAVAGERVTSRTLAGRRDHTRRRGADHDRARPASDGIECEARSASRRNHRELLPRVRLALDDAHGHEALIRAIECVHQRLTGVTRRPAERERDWCALERFDAEPVGNELR